MLVIDRFDHDSHPYKTLFITTDTRNNVTNDI